MGCVSVYYTAYIPCLHRIYMVLGPHISRPRTAYIPSKDHIYAVQTRDICGITS